MKIAALILGIIGGIWGTIWGLFVVASSAADPAGGEIAAIGLATIILSICGIVGGGVTIRNAKAGGILLLIGSAGMIILLVGMNIITTFSPSWGTIVPMLLLIVGGVLGLSASRQI